MKLLKKLSLVLAMLVPLMSVGCSKCAHNNKYLVEDTATCTHTGIATYRCYTCGANFTEDSPMKPHEYKEISDTATCEKAGTKTFQCEHCTSTTQESSPAKGHQYYDNNCFCSRCHNHLNPDCKTHTMTSKVEIRDSKEDPLLICEGTKTFTITPTTTRLVSQEILLAYVTGEYLINYFIFNKEGDRVYGDIWTGVLTAGKYKTIKGDLDFDIKTPLPQGSTFYTLHRIKALF